MLVEIKSVNHRYLDLHIKIPPEFQNFENVIRQKVSGQFKRGRLDAFVRIDYKRENIKLDVNHNLIRAYVELMSEIKNDYPVQGRPDAGNDHATARTCYCFLQRSHGRGTAS